MRGLRHGRGVVRAEQLLGDRRHGACDGVVELNVDLAVTERGSQRGGPELLLRAGAAERVPPEQPGVGGQLLTSPGLS